MAAEAHKLVARELGSFRKSLSSVNRQTVTHWPPVYRMLFSVHFERRRLFPLSEMRRTTGRAFPAGEGLIRRRRCGGRPFCGSGRFGGPLTKQVPGDRQNDHHEGKDFLG